MEYLENGNIKIKMKNGTVQEIAPNALDRLLELQGEHIEGLADDRRAKPKTRPKKAAPAPVKAAEDLPPAKEGEDAPSMAWSKKQLQDKATELGVTWQDNDTKKMLLAAIQAKS